MFVTNYTKSVKRRATGRVERVPCIYRTKSETPMHKHIRKTYPGAQTVRDPERVITHFIPGWPLETPIFVGGTPVQ